MSVLYVLILISGLIAIAFLIGFIWSVRSGQFDDTYSPARRILFNDGKPQKRSDKKLETKQKDYQEEQ